MKSKRAYRQTSRASSTEATMQRAVDAAEQSLRTAERLSDITLDEIAERSGVTVRTILRRFGSRDDLLTSAFAQLHKNISGRRMPTEGGNIDLALEALMNHYELDGDFGIRGLAQEHEYPPVHEALEKAREHHRGWLEEVFSPHLARLSPAAREQRLTELYAATDIYVWKLLRRDFHLSAKKTAETMRNLVMSILQRKEK